MRFIIIILFFALSACAQVASLYTSDYNSPLWIESEFCDDLDYPNATILSTTNDWEQEKGQLAIYNAGSDGEAYGSVASTEVAAYYNRSINSNQFSMGVASNSLATNSSIGPAVRCQGGTGYYYGWYSTSTASYLGVNKGVSWIQLATGNSWTVTDEVKLAVHGDELFCYRNGVLDASIDSDGRITIPSAHLFYGGYSGICAFGNNSSVRFDDWCGGSFIAPDTVIWYELAHDLFVHTPESQVNGDRILELTPNRHWKVLDEWVYTLLDNTDDFYISDTILYTYGSLSPGLYDITYTLSDSILIDTAHIYVTVTDDDDNVYIDFGWTGTETGTRSEPHNSLFDFSFASNTNYYMKRGETSSAYTSEITIANVNHIILGAYGTGDVPAILSNYNPGVNNPCMRFNNVDYSTIRDFRLYTTINTRFLIGNYNQQDSLFFDHLHLHGQDNYYDPYQGFRIDGESRWGGMRNCIIHDIGRDGAWTIWQYGTSYDAPFFWEANWVYDVNKDADWDVVIETDGDCLDIHAYDPTPDNHRDSKFNLIRYNLLSRANNVYKHALLYQYDPDSASIRSCNTIIEYNRCEGYQGVDTYGQNMISVYCARGAIIRYNITNSGTRGIYTPSEPYARSDPDNWYLEIYGNLLINFKDQGMRFYANTDYSEIYNNTFYSDQITSGSDRVGIYIYTGGGGSADYLDIKNNNFYIDDADLDYMILDGPGTMDEDYNNFYPSAVGFTEGANSTEYDPDFITGYDSDYEIDETSPIYHIGDDLGLYQDGWKTTWGPTPSMGYKEVVEE